MNTLWGGLWDINRITQPVLSGLVISDEASSGLSVNLSTASASLSVYNQGRFVPGAPWSLKLKACTYLGSLDEAD